MGILDELKDASAKLADSATKKANEAFDLGKKKMNEMSLENDLAKAQKQLGVLVYTLYKTGEENAELVDEYIQRIVVIETELDNLKSEEDTVEVTGNPVCTACNAPLSNEDKFCKACGTKQGE